MNPVRNLLHRKWHWILERKFLWISLVLACSTGIVVILPSPIGTAPDLIVRIWAMSLQIIGAATVWHDLTGTAREFGRTETISAIWEYLKRGFTNKPIILEVAGTSQGNSSSSARVTQRPPIKPDDPDAARIATLERYISYIDAESQVWRLNREKQRTSFQRRCKKISNHWRARFATPIID